MFDIINDIKYNFFKSELFRNNYKLHIYAHPNELLHEHATKTLNVFEYVADYSILKKFYNSFYSEGEFNFSFNEYILLIKQMFYFHDIGKISLNFQLYKLNSGINGLNEMGIKQKDIINNMFDNMPILRIFDYNHSFTGSIIFLELFNKYKLSNFLIILSYCIMGHHTNIKDFKQIDLKKTERNVVLKTIYLIVFFIKTTDFNNDNELNEDISNKWNLLKNQIKELQENYHETNTYYSSFYQYMYSLLITSDVIASSQYYLTEVSTEKNNNRIDEKLLEKMHNGFYEYNNSLKNDITINQLRYDMYLESSKNLLKALQDENNKIFYLNMPTGGGKTNTSMKLALDIVENTDVNRIIYAMPFINIVDQNYDVICKNYNLEDNRDVRKICSTNTFPTEDKDEEYLAEILMNDDFLDYPVVCTTFVRLFNTIIRNNKRNKYAFASLSNSVVILDEVQSLPIKNWSSLYYILNDISDKLNIYFIFMSATLPEFKKLDDKYSDFNYLPLIKEPQIYYDSEEFNDRTKIMGLPEEFKIDDRKSLEEYLIDIISNNFKEDYSKGLIVLNTVKSSKLIYEIIKEFENKLDFEVDLLNSTIMNHKKKEIIEKINAMHNKRYILVSTQSIEAGVDVSFNFVIRDFATLDSIEQIRGRCNRHNELPQGKSGRIYLIILKDENNKELYSHIYNKEEMDTRIKETKRLITTNNNINYMFNDLKNYYDNISKIKHEITTNKEKKLESNDNDNINSWNRMLYSNFDNKEGIHIIEDSNQITLFLMTNIPITHFKEEEIKYLKNVEKDLDYKLIENDEVIGENILKYYNFDHMKGVTDFTKRKIIKKEFNSILDKFLINTYIKDELRDEYRANKTYKEYNEDYYFFEVIPADLIGDGNDKLYSIRTGLNHDYKYFNNFESRCCL